MDSNIAIKFCREDKTIPTQIVDKLSLTALTDKHKSILETKAWWTANHSILQKKLEELVPGTHVVAVPWDSKILKYALDNGAELRVVSSTDISMPMTSRACHNNCEYLLRKGVINEYHSGYALSEDRLWRFHSWGISPDNKIVETTEPRIAYLVIGTTYK